MPYGLAAAVLDSILQKIFSGHLRISVPSWSIVRTDGEGSPGKAKFGKGENEPSGKTDFQIFSLASLWYFPFPSNKYCKNLDTQNSSDA